MHFSSLFLSLLRSLMLLLSLMQMFVDDDPVLVTVKSHKHVPYIYKQRLATSLNTHLTIYL